jgi:hypothetical protein
VAAAPHEPVDAELEPEEEQKEDEADLRNEVGDLRRLYELDEARLVRAEDDPCEQVRGDRREPEPARREPEDAESAT